MTYRWARSVIGHDAADAPHAKFQELFLTIVSQTNVPRTLLSWSRKRMSCTPHQSTRLKVPSNCAASC